MDKKVEMIGDKVTKNYFRYVSQQGQEVTGAVFIRKDLMAQIAKDTPVPTKIVVTVTI